MILASASALLCTILIASCSGPMESAAQDEYKPEITHTATLKTALGDIVLELYGKDAPKTVANFVELADEGTYDGVLFHRVVKDFVIQGGDPKSKDPALKDDWGTGGTSIYDGKEFADELNPEAPSYRRGYVEGAVAMANRGPNTQTSQFFIMTSTKGADALPHKYTIFGYVREGMDVVRAIEENGVGAPPQNPVEIESVSVDQQ